MRPHQVGVVVRSTLLQATPQSHHTYLKRLFTVFLKLQVHLKMLHDVIRSALLTAVAIFAGVCAATTHDFLTEFEMQEGYVTFFTLVSFLGTFSAFSWVGWSYFSKSKKRLWPKSSCVPLNKFERDRLSTFTMPINHLILVLLWTNQITNRDPKNQLYWLLWVFWLYFCSFFRLA